MSAPWYAILAVSVLAGGQPSDVVSQDDRMEAVAPLPPLVGEARPVLAADSPAALPILECCEGCQQPCFVIPRCRMRWYTAVNVVYHKRPYDYVTQFDYPWHPEPSCSGCPVRLGSDTPIVLPHAVLAPLAPSEDTLRGGLSGGRPSAIQTVD